MTATLLPSELPPAWGFPDFDIGDTMDLQPDSIVPRTHPATDAAQALHSVLYSDQPAPLNDSAKPSATVHADATLSNGLSKLVAVYYGAGESTTDDPMRDAANAETNASDEMQTDPAQNAVDYDHGMPDIQGQDVAMPDSTQDDSFTDEPMVDTPIEGDERNDFFTLFESNQHSFNNPLNESFDDAELFGRGFAFDDELVPKHNYELRPGFRSDVVPLGAEPEDYDETADFSPAEEERRLRLANRRRRAPRPRITEVYSTDEESPSEQDDHIAQLPWPKIEVRVAFQTKEARECYSDMVEAFEAKMLAAVQVESREGRKLRDRAKNTGTVEPGVRDHLGHPEARGCRHCHGTGVACSILDNEFEWPCEACKDAGRTCTMVIPPVRKLACEQCTSLGKHDQDLVCSFVGEDNPAGTCQKCQEHGYSCAARPDPATIQPRNRIDSDGTVYSYDKPNILSQPKPADERPQAQPAPDESLLFVPEDGDTPIEEVPPIAQPASTTMLDDQLHQLGVQAPAAPLSVATKSPWQIYKEARARRPMVMKLKTKFCHPMSFNHVPTKEDPCLFCSTGKFKYYGYGEKRPLVRERPLGQGWTELKDGHEAGGYPPTKMCKTCTCERGDIICCARHELEEIKDKDNFAELIDSMSFDCDDVFKVCSVCINPARWECTTLNERTDDLPERCGLQLCEICYVALLALKGNLTNMLTELQDRTSMNRPQGLRADYQLLKDDGLLCRYLTKQ